MSLPMELVCDLHLHSKFSRAVSKKMDLSNMYLWARKKGINVLSVADFTHPEWYSMLCEELVEVREGVYSLNTRDAIAYSHSKLFLEDFLGPYFLLTTEISLIYSQDGQVYRVHLLVLAPDLKTVGRVNKTFLQHGFNLKADGRPTFGISATELCEMLFAIDSRIHIIPCHIWTPWFSLYGSRSGFDSIRECFGEYAEKIFAVETGLSSDPAMNWRIEELENKSIVSFGDAHSFYKLGREATVLKKRKAENERRAIVEDDITYSNIIEGMRLDGKGLFEIGYTIEFYPEEGKYHFTGHRMCGVVQDPQETKKKGSNCPVCAKLLTVGVMHRVEDLATLAVEQNSACDAHGVVWKKDARGIRPPFVSLVPLQEIISEVLGRGVTTKGVLSLYERMVVSLGSEFDILLRVPLSRIAFVAGGAMSEAIAKVRSGDISIKSGYDGVFGTISIDLSKKDGGSSQLELGFS